MEKSKATEKPQKYKQQASALVRPRPQKGLFLYKSHLTVRLQVTLNRLDFKFVRKKMTR